MRKIALACAGSGVALVVIAVVARFIGQPTLNLGSHSFQSQTILVVANTALLFGVFALLFDHTKKK